MPQSGAQHNHLWRIVFVAAGLYNIAFGTWAVLFPKVFFQWFDLELPNVDWVWSCLGMVIGVYGLGFLHVAWKPNQGDVIVVLGLLGKVLGPIGWLIAVSRSEIPPRTFPMILFNDLVWWFPFLAFLLRRYRNCGVAVALLTVAFHVVACVLLLTVRQGTDANPDIAVRMSFIRDSAFQWTACWYLWSLASLSLLAFFSVWASRLLASGANWRLLTSGWSLCSIGLVFDLTSEAMAIGTLTDSTLTSLQFETWARRMSIFGAGVGNGLYCLGGIVMSIASWNVGFQRGWRALHAGSIWLMGLGLSTTTFLNATAAMTFFAAALMLLFIPWAAMTGVTFGRRFPQ